MSKIICDICGTTYPDTQDQCPICGCTRDAGAELLGDDILAEELLEEVKGKGGKFSNKKKKEIFDYDEVNGDVDSVDAKDEQNPYDEEEDEEYEEAPKSNVFLIILLTLLIVGLLAGAGFLFYRYVMPNLGWGDEPVETTAAVETTEAPTTVPSVPCQDLIMTSGKTAELNAEGQYFMLHVIASPADTTDKIQYESSDESIVTVTEDGRLTAVSEGEATIFITCGDFQLTCNVVCKFVEETLPPVTEAPVETAPAETDGETAGETRPEETAGETVGEAVEETKPASVDGVKLKLKKTDISLAVYYQFTLELDCDLKPEDIEWKSEHSHIATVDDKGVVTAKKSGTTAIIAKYGDQEVQCIIRCYK